MLSSIITSPASRGLENNSGKKARWEKEADYMKTKWTSVIEQDPYYNPALSLISEDFSLAKPPRYRKPWEKQGEGVAIHDSQIGRALLQATLVSPGSGRNRGSQPVASSGASHHYRCHSKSLKNCTPIIRINKAELPHNPMLDEEEIYECAPKEQTHFLETTFESTDKSATFSVLFSPSGKNYEIPVFQIPVGDIQATNLKLPIIHSIDGIFGSRQH